MRIETIAVILSLIRECASQPFLKYFITAFFTAVGDRDIPIQKRTQQTS